jgi:hypothetical protein
MTPYRDAQAELHFPLCGDGLDTLRDGLAACLTCHELWLGMSTIAVAFGMRVWPVGANVWTRPWPSQLLHL